MMFFIFLLVISFIMEGLFSTIVPMDSLFCPLFTIVCLISIYPYFKKYDQNYWKTCIVVGFCYDIIYTNTVLVYAGLFLAIGYFASILYRFFPHRVWNHMFLIFLSLTGYRVIGFLLLVITGVISFSATRLIDSIVSSLIVNLIYCIFLYGILEILRKQKKITLQR